VLGITFGELLLTILYIWLLFLLLGLLFHVFGDLFRRDISGWAKAAWSIVIVLIPFLGMLVYVIVRGKGWSEDHARWAAENRKALQTELGVNTADELEKLAALRDAGKISNEEYEQAKSRLL
jgi:hypothetical protein